MARFRVKVVIEDMKLSAHREDINRGLKFWFRPAGFETSAQNLKIFGGKINEAWFNVLRSRIYTHGSRGVRPVQRPRERIVHNIGISRFVPRLSIFRHISRHDILMKDLDLAN